MYACMSTTLSPNVVPLMEDLLAACGSSGSASVVNEEHNGVAYLTLESVCQHHFSKVPTDPVAEENSSTVSKAKVNSNVC